MNTIGNVLQGLNNEFVGFTEDISYKLNITNQHRYFEHYLNDVFDPINRDIHIATYQLTRPVYIYTALELKNVYIRTVAEGDPLYIKTVGEVNSQYNYIIYVPSSLVFDMDIFINHVDKYNPVGKIYQIQTY